VGAPTEIDLIHANLPAHVDTASARLPQSYEAAKRALAECERLDECKEWSDKMAALASYARQVEDETLLKTAMRIHGRALRRVGELLKAVAIGREQGGRPPQNGGGVPTVSQRAAAVAVGLSKDQQVAAVRVANIPAEEFEAAIESDSPPTVTKLAEAGTKLRNPLGFDYLEGRDPQKFNAAIHTLGAMKLLAAKCSEHAPEFVAEGVGAREAQHARELVAGINGWLDRFAASIKD
jgi:hypothetical protein